MVSLLQNFLKAALWTLYFIAASTMSASGDARGRSMSEMANGGRTCSEGEGEGVSLRTLVAS